MVTRSTGWSAAGPGGGEGTTARTSREDSGFVGPPDWMSLISIGSDSPSPVRSVGGRGSHRHDGSRAGGLPSLSCPPVRSRGPLEVGADDGRNADAAVPGQVRGQHLVVQLVIEVSGRAPLGAFRDRPPHALEELGQEEGLERLGRVAGRGRAQAAGNGGQVRSRGKRIYWSEGRQPGSI